MTKEFKRYGNSDLDKAWVRLYTVDNIVSETGLSEKHIKDFIKASFQQLRERWDDFCLNCLDKHSHDLIGYADEATGFDPDHTVLWQELAAVANEVLDLLSENPVFLEGPQSEKECKKAKEEIAPLKDKLRDVRLKIAPVARALRRQHNELKRSAGGGQRKETVAGTKSDPLLFV